jgi:hypothetical protein
MPSPARSPAVVETTHADPVRVIRALGLANPAAASRPATEIEQELALLSNRETSDRYTHGKLAALAWTAVAAQQAPGSRLPWHAADPLPNKSLPSSTWTIGRIYQTADTTARTGPAAAELALTQ